MMLFNYFTAKPAVITAGFLLLTMGCLLFNCGPREQEQEKQLRPDTQAGAQHSMTESVNVEELLIQLLVMQERIKGAPEVVSLRHEMVNLSLDTDHNVIYTMGIGLFPENAANTAIARQSAERAAYLDACRWGAYVMRWKDNADSLAFGSIQGELPNAAVVHKTMSPDGTQAYALVRIEL